MKGFFKFLGTAALVAVIGFSMVSCSNGDDSSSSGGGIPAELVGTWDGLEDANQIIKFTSSQIFVCNATTEPTYLHDDTTISGDTITHKIGSHLIGDAKWSLNASKDVLTISESTIILIPDGNYNKVNP